MSPADRGQRGRAVQHAAMLDRLEQYAGLRQAGKKPREAVRELGLKDRAAAPYERWYRTQAGLPPQPRGDWRMWGR